MSTTAFAVNDANAVKLWSKEVAEAEREEADIAKLMGKDDNSIIQIKEDFSKNNAKGDQVTFNLRVRIGGGGFSEGEKAQGNATGLTFYTDALLINELGQTVGCKPEGATIDAQRVPFNVREQGKNALVEWWGTRKSVVFFNHVCGYTPANAVSATSGPKFTGFNTVVAPSSTRIIRPGGHADDESITSSDIFVTALIDRAKEAAKIGDNSVRPTMVGGMPKYVMYIDPAQVTQLRTSSGSTWVDITKFAYSGLNPKDNPIYNGALGEWNGVILRESQDITQGVNSSTGAADTDVRRAVLLGAQAAVCGYGGANKYGPMKYRWSEELFDHGRELEVGAWSIWGLKKTRFNSVDHGVVVVSTYAVRAV